MPRKMNTMRTRSTVRGLTRPIPPSVRDFPSLIRWLADEFHQGAVIQVAERARLSPANAHLWVHGRTRNPKIESLEALCAAYSLDFDDVRALVRRSWVPPISGGSGAADGPHAVEVLEMLSLIRRWLLGWAWPLLLPVCSA